METNVKLRAALFGTLILGGMLGCEETTAPTTPPTIESTPRFTMGSGTTSTLVGRGSFVPGFKVKRESNGWEAEVEVKPDLDVAVQTITFAAGSQSGWHRHPGPVFITVKTGTMTFYESDDPTCTPIIRSAGQGYLDTGEHAHIARNESTAPAENVVVYFAPLGAALRIDAPDPGNCSF
ncbi:MAG TPA: cupin domain-containing protein [Gemmatimonadota bacterium]|nr:cupin domain-containing protein [Gemmatimonadota bacterium]